MSLKKAIELLESLKNPRSRLDSAIERLQKAGGARGGWNAARGTQNAAKPQSRSKPGAMGGTNPFWHLRQQSSDLSYEPTHEGQKHFQTGAPAQKLKIQVWEKGKHLGTAHFELHHDHIKATHFYGKSGEGDEGEEAVKNHSRLDHGKLTSIAGEAHRSWFGHTNPVTVKTLHPDNTFQDIGKV